MMSKSMVLKIAKNFVLIAFIMMVMLLISSWLYDLINSQSEKVVLNVGDAVYQVHRFEDIDKIIANNKQSAIEIVIVDTAGNEVDRKSLNLDEISMSYVQEQELEQIKYALDDNKFGRFFGKLRKLEFDRVFQPFVHLKNDSKTGNEIMIGVNQPVYDKDDLKAWVVRNMHAINRKSRMASLVVENGQVVQLPPKNGVVVDMAEVMDKITAALSSEGEMSAPIVVQAMIEPVDVSNQEALKQYTKILGHTKVEINGQDPDVMLAKDEVIGILSNKAISKGARFSLYDIFYEISNVSALRDSSYETIRLEFEEILLDMMYKILSSGVIKVESIVFWNDSVKIGDMNMLLQREQEYPIGLVFDNTSAYNIIISTWYAEDAFHMALIGSE